MNKSPCLLGLDLGTSTGWSLYKDGEIVSGVINFSPRSDTPVGKQYAEYFSFLNNFTSVDRVCFEKVDFLSTLFQAHKYGGWMMILYMWCYMNKKPEATTVAVSTLKKHVTGNGKAEKEQILATLQAKGYDVTQEDQADAFGAMSFGLKKHYGIEL